MRRALVALLICAASPVLADPSEAELAGFEACVADLYAENIENFTATMGVPVICGTRHIPPEQSCNFVSKLTDPVGCLEKDHAYWSDRLAANLAAYDVEDIAENSLLDNGLKRCAEENEQGVPRTTCEMEALWRDAMITQAMPIMTAVREAAE